MGVVVFSYHALGQRRHVGYLRRPVLEISRLMVMVETQTPRRLSHLAPRTGSDHHRVMVIMILNMGPIFCAVSRVGKRRVKP